MSTKIKLLSLYKEQLITFLDELIEQFPIEGDLVILRIFFGNQIDTATVIDIFLERINTNSNQLRKMIKERNETFFLEHDAFYGTDQSKVSHFRNLWLSNDLDDETKVTIWNWIDIFVSIADKYSKEKD
jgi:L-arabinose isomerase